MPTPLCSQSVSAPRPEGGGAESNAPPFHSALHTLSLLGHCLWSLLALSVPNTVGGTRGRMMPGPYSKSLCSHWGRQIIDKKIPANNKGSPENKTECHKKGSLSSHTSFLLSLC